MKPYLLRRASGLRMFVAIVCPLFISAFTHANIPPTAETSFFSASVIDLEGAPQKELEEMVFEYDIRASRVSLPKSPTGAIVRGWVQGTTASGGLGKIENLFSWDPALGFGPELASIRSFGWLNAYGTLFTIPAGLKFAGADLKPRWNTPNEAVTDVLYHFISDQGATTSVRARFVLSTRKLDPKFVSKKLDPRFGYFHNQGFYVKDLNSARIARFSFAGGRKIHFYIRNAPPESIIPIRKAFNAWNQLFARFGIQPALTYEFIDPRDPKQDEVRFGDSRFFVLDLGPSVNHWGGVGMQHADPITGEILGASIWINNQNRINNIKKWMSACAGITIDAYLRDPPPCAWTLDAVLQHLTQNTVTHEIGHALGLMHNYMGTIGQDPRGISTSIMDYTPKSMGIHSEIGLYDLQAIGWGYFGIEPARGTLQPFCNDEASEPSDGFSPFNAECSEVDAGADPYGRFRGILRQALELGIESPGIRLATTALATDLGLGIRGMLNYAQSAEKFSHLWIRFHHFENRPRNPAKIIEYIRRDLEATLCSPRWQVAIDRESRLDEKQKAIDTRDLALKNAREAIAKRKLTEKLPISCLNP